MLLKKLKTTCYKYQTHSVYAFKINCRLVLKKQLKPKCPIPQKKEILVRNKLQLPNIQSLVVDKSTIRFIFVMYGT